MENKLHEFYHKIYYNKLSDDFSVLECLNLRKKMPDTRNSIASSSSTLVESASSSELVSR